MTFQPLHDRVMVKPDVSQTHSASGLIILSGELKKPQTGTVIAVGTGSIDKKGNKQPLCVSVGDRVTVANWGDNEVQYEGAECYLVLEQDIVALG